jgi:hypothetical protein
MIEKRTSTPSVDNYTIVAHGHHNAMDYAYGLSMPLMAGTMTKATQDVLQPLLDFMNKGAADSDMDDFEKKQSDPTVSADQKVTIDDKGTPARYPKGGVKKLVAKMRELRRLKVRKVEFRACTLGTNLGALAVIGKCFSARFAYAPTEHMFYTRVATNRPVSQERYVKVRDGYGNAREFANVFGIHKLALRLGGSGVSRHMDAVTTADSVGWFVNRNLWPDNNYVSGGAAPSPFYLVGIDSHGAKAFVLPREPEYPQYIKWVGPLEGNMI